MAGYHGTLQNNPTVVNTPWGTGYSFNGTNQSILLPNQPGPLSNLAPASSWTVEYCFKTSTVALQYALGAHSGNGLDVAFGTDSSGRLYIVPWGKSYGPALQPAGNVCDGNWHWVVVSMQGGYTAQVYLDGTYVGVISSPYGYAPPAGPGNAAAIGTDPSVGSWWTGSIDEVAIYTVAQSQAWVSQRWNNGHLSQLLNTEPNLVALYHLDSNAFDTAGLTNPLGNYRAQLAVPPGCGQVFNPGDPLFIGSTEVAIPFLCDFGPALGSGETLDGASVSCSVGNVTSLGYSAAASGFCYLPSPPIPPYSPTAVIFELGTSGLKASIGSTYLVTITATTIGGRTVEALYAPISCIG